MFSLVTTIISGTLLFGFIIVSLIKYGIPISYSYFYYLWGEGKIWSIITVLSGLFLGPKMIELGEGSVLQFLGFFAPIYLCGVGLSPRIQESMKTRIIHTSLAICCGICCCTWQIFIIENFIYLLLFLILVFLVSLITKTIKSSYTFWVELSMFMSTYYILLFLR